MNDQDAFAVWIASAMLRASNDEFAEEALASLASQAKTSAELDKLVAEAAGDRRPGDFGVDFVGALVPALLISFGRVLWDAYAKSLTDQGAKALAAATIDKVKKLARRTWSRSSDTISLIDAETRLREAASRTGLDAAQTEKLVSCLHSPEMADVVAAE